MRFRVWGITRSGRLGFGLEFRVQGRSSLSSSFLAKQFITDSFEILEGETGDVNLWTKTVLS